MKKWFAKIFKKEDSKKIPLPEEYQIRILFEFNKKQLLNILEKYELKAHHLNLIGNAFKTQKEYKLAENAYKDAIKLAPEYDEPYGNLMALYITQKKYELCEDVYQKGMTNATKKTFIIYQDGRVAFDHGNYEQAFRAALCVLTDEGVENESALVLAILSSLSLVREEKDIEKNYREAFDWWKIGMSIFPDSEALNGLSKYFADDVNITLKKQNKNDVANKDRYVKEFENIIYAYCQRNCEPKPNFPITLNTNFKRDLYFDGLDMMEICLILEKKYSISLPEHSPLKQRLEKDTDYTVGYLLSQYGLI